MAEFVAAKEQVVKPGDVVYENDEVFKPSFDVLDYSLNIVRFYKPGVYKIAIDENGWSIVERVG